MTEDNKITQYYLELEDKHKKHKEKCKKYYRDNHEAELQKRAELRETEEYKERMAEYRQSEAGKKSARISCWKQWGIISDDYDALYIKWKETSHCEECDVELIEGNKGKNKKVIDHDHKTGAFRNIVCNSCNVKRGNKDRGVVRQTKEQYEQNRTWKYQQKDFQLKWAFKRLISQL